MHYCITDFRSFDIVYDTPVLSIVKAPDSPIYIRRDKTLRYTLQVEDINKNTSLIFYHSINNSKSYNILNKTDIQVNPFQFEYDIPVPTNITEGVYEISIVARDQNKQISNLVKNIIKFSKSTENRFVDAIKKYHMNRRYIVPFFPRILFKTSK